MNDLVQYPWQETLLDAFLSPAGAVPAKVEAAERRILARLEQWSELNSSEQMALEDALRALKVLTSEAVA